MNLPFLTFLSISLVLFGCREPRDIYRSISSEAKEWLDFKEGSYWVMKEKSSGLIDTIYVANYEVKMNQTPVDNHFEESITIEMNSTQTNNPSYILASASSLGILFKRDLNMPNRSYLLKFPITQGDSVNSSDNFSQFVHFDTVYSKYSIGVLDFNHVVRSYDNLNPVYGYTPTKFYFAKGAGIIKMEFLSTNKIYETIEYEIVK